MSGKDDSFDISSAKEKKIRFDEENIRATLYPQQKSYGFMLLSDAQTPYPKHSNPVEAEALRKRLQTCIQNANNDSECEDDDERSINYDELETPMNSLASESEEQRHIKFLRKRKQYNYGEFIIAQQRVLSCEMPKPGPSIGDNWRLTDTIDEAALRIPSPLSSFIESYSKRQSSLNYESLREVVKHINEKASSFKY